MIRNYNDHAANERTFLAWMRTGLSAIALGILVKKGSIFAVVIAGASLLRRRSSLIPQGLLLASMADRFSSE